MLRIFLCISLIFQISSIAVRQCSFLTPHFKFYKVRNCYKSNKTAIALKSVSEVGECMKFAREKKGLAFNFSPGGVFLNDTQLNVYANCEVLGCPETTNSTTFVPDPSFDYYTAYGNFNSKFKLRTTCFYVNQCRNAFITLLSVVMSLLI